MPSVDRKAQLQAGTSPELLHYAHYILTTFFNILAEKISREGHGNWTGWEIRMLSWDQIREILQGETEYKRMMGDRRAMFMRALEEDGPFEMSIGKSEEEELVQTSLIRFSADEMVGLILSPHDYQFYNRLLRVLMDMGFEKLEEFAWIEGLHQEVGTLVRQYEDADAPSTVQVENAQDSPAWDSDRMVKLLGEWMEKMRLAQDRVSALQEVEVFAKTEIEKRRVEERRMRDKKDIVVTVKELDQILV